MAETRQKKLSAIDSLSEVPEGMTEAEEAEFWSTHYLSDRVKVYAVAADDPDFPPPRTESPKISLRLETDVLKRLKAVAYRKRMGYQTLLKAFVIERLYEEEKREGMI